MRILRNFLAPIAFLLATTAAFSQGCSMCKASAEAAAAEEQKALNHGILLLAIPSVVIFGGLTIFAVRYRSKELAEPLQNEKDRNTDLL
jgi:heme/copper-type cytochrome/quinol oxidase subunit 2